MNMWKDQNVRLASVFVVGILVGMGIYWLGLNQAGTVRNADTHADTNATSSVTGLESDAENIKAPALRVDDQNPGKAVVLAQVVLDEPAWVVIHDDVNGKPGNVLGAQLYDKGRTSGFVSLLRATEVGKKYIAVLHTYRNVKKPFDVKLDVPLKNEQGEFVTASFQVTIAND